MLGFPESVEGQSVEEADIVAALRARTGHLDKLFVEFDWSECRAPIESDPFDRRNWELDEMAHTAQYEARILRPHYLLRFSSPFHRDVATNWVDDIRVSRGLNNDRTWSVTRDRDRWLTVGGLPVLTPLELWQTFDIQQSILEMIERGELALERATANEVVLSGDRVRRKSTMPPRWSVRAVLDPSRGMLPLRISAVLEMDGIEDIEWEMATVGSVLLAEVHAIEEAILVLTNRNVNRKKWQVYHYKVKGIRRDDSLTKQRLQIDIPRANVTVIDEVDLFVRETNGRGQVVSYERWTSEERAQQIEAMQNTHDRWMESQGTIAQRQRVLAVILASAAAVALITLAGWVWHRRRLAAA
ncbi:MAG: hypothetical protein KKI02_07595 [Planctomycetes bacterium]|nr:hypothetical protein [Planctomycetota bacterium]